MATSRDLLGTLLLVLCVVTGVVSVEKCRCSYSEWDCTNLQKTVILTSDVCNIAKKWLLAGNKLRRFPDNETLTEAVEHIDISDNELSLGIIDSSENGLYSKLKYLNVQKNGISTLNFLNGPGNYSGQCKVNTLIASQNSLTDVLELRNCYNLIRIIIDNNKISSLPEKSFTAGYWPSNLLEIDLSFNPISYIAPGAFGELRALTSFNLSNTGVLSGLPPTIFKGFYALQYLLLNGNQLREFPEGLFDGLEKLMVLNLQNNKLETLKEEIFYSLGNLKFLDLDDNMLVEISPKVFSRLHSLEELSIRNNRLKTIPSLAECSAPIVSVAFNKNLITELEETPVRALLRYGFQIGDIRENPLQHNSTAWIKNTTDLQLSWDTWEQLCGEVRLLRAPGHGIIKFCPGKQASG